MVFKSESCFQLYIGKPLFLGRNKTEVLQEVGWFVFLSTFTCKPLPSADNQTGFLGKKAKIIVCIIKMGWFWKQLKSLCTSHCITQKTGDVRVFYCIFMIELLLGSNFRQVFQYKTVLFERYFLPLFTGWSITKILSSSVVHTS